VATRLGAAQRDPELAIAVCVHPADGTGVAGAATAPKAARTRLVAASRRKRLSSISTVFAEA
jgi:hypothetical protein